MSFVRVALEVPVAALFDYSVDGAQGLLGCRVAVPFGPRTLVGVVVEAEVVPAVDLARIKPARVLEDVPVLPVAWIDLLRFCAGYYQHPLGNAIGAALPARLKADKPLDPALWQRFAWRGLLPAFAKREHARAAIASRLAAGPCFGYELTSVSPKALAYIHAWQAAGLVQGAESAPLQVGGPFVWEPSRHSGLAEG